MEKEIKFLPNPKAKLMDQVREVLRYHQYAYRTEQSYCQWILRYLHFFGGQTHPRLLNSKNVEQFLTHLVVNRNASASTQRQALNGLVFLYVKVLDMPFEGKVAPIRSKKHKRLPVVLTTEEVKVLFLCMDGMNLLMAKILYGAGLRLMECLRLRVQDVDFGTGKIFVRAGKGGKDRVTFLPRMVREQLFEQIRRVEGVHLRDLQRGYGEAVLPKGLSLKYPNAAKEFIWQFVFPSKKISVDPQSGMKARHHVQESGLQKAVRRAAKQSEIAKHVTCHTLRHSFATHLLENGNNIRVVQKLMGHADVKTTEIYTHVMQSDMDASQSPLDLF